MEAIRKLLAKNPELLKVDSRSPDKEERKHRYEQVIDDNFDKFEDIAEEAQALIMTMQHWRLEAGEKVFEFGKAIAVEYALDLGEIDRLFNHVLPRWSRGPLLGFLISGTYHEIIQEDDRLLLDLTKYPGAISGFGYKQPQGSLELVGNRAFYLGVRMTGGKVVLRGHAANHIGKYLQGGQIIIEGNTRNWVGQKMHGGVIAIKGNAGDIIGQKMTGGEIIVEGNAGGWIADGMKSGIIRIKGDCGQVDEGRPGGEIFEWRDNQWTKID